MTRKTTSPKAPPVASDAARTFDAALDESVGFLIADTSRFVKRALYARIAKYGIRGGSWFFLRALWELDGVTQRELAQRLGIMEPSVLEMLRAMEKDGLVRRERDTQDRRKVRVYLTDHARTLEPTLMGIATEVNDIMLKELSAAEEILIKLMLRKIRDTLTRDMASIAEAIEDDGPLLAVKPVSVGKVTTKTATGKVAAKETAPVVRRSRK